MGDKLGIAKGVEEGRLMLIDNGTRVRVIGGNSDQYNLPIEDGPPIAREV